MQETPCHEYWQELALPGVHYVCYATDEECGTNDTALTSITNLVSQISVDSNLDNLTAAVLWAKFHDTEVQQIIENAHTLLSWVLSTDGIYTYTRELLLAYTERITYPVNRLAGAVRFVCNDSGKLTFTPLFMRKKKNVGSFLTPARALLRHRLLL